MEEDDSFYKEEQVPTTTQLDQILSTYNLVRQKIPMDGHCQFRSMAHQLQEVDPDILAKLQNEADTIHLALRSQVIKWMRSNKGFFLQEGFLPEEYIGPEDDRDNFFNDEVSFN